MKIEVLKDYPDNGNLTTQFTATEVLRIVYNLFGNKPPITGDPGCPGRC